MKNVCAQKFNFSNKFDLICTYVLGIPLIFPDPYTSQTMSAKSQMPLYDSKIEDNGIFGTFPRSVYKTRKRLCCFMQRF
jgi:hypothetical protein